MKKKILSLFLVMLTIVCSFANTVFADQENVVSLGADLTPKQQEEMLEHFGVKRDEVRIIEVTNQEERDYLSGLVPDKQIGTRAISSAYVQLLPKGEGIMVDTHNITWVSKEMYANAMVTAGIEDAKVIVAAPFNVSGTAALTGIMKAFEEISGEELSDEAKKTANEELVLTGDLGEEVGQEEAAELIKKVKEEVVLNKPKDESEIEDIIRDIAKQLGIELTDEQIAKIIELMKKISQLNLNVETITKQLDKIGISVDDIKKTVEENKGILEKILDAITEFFSWVRSFFK
ncbi:MAG TPA: DUF1002 domain-containing protein [Clostridiales bacterium]|nr:DUF1002 domain-containing protein [Clostridiales bacterium]